MDQPEEPRRTVRVLIVDDDDDLLESLTLLFRKRQYEVMVASSAEEALTAIAVSAPHILLTDLRLPGKSGLELLRAVHEAYPQIPVVMMTAYGDDAVVELATRLGAYRVLTKPVPRDDLFRTVGRALESSGA